MFVRSTRLGGSRPTDCRFRSRYPRKPVLSANAMIVMERTELELSGCSFRKCKHAVNFLGKASLRADECTFEQMNASVRNVAGGGAVVVGRCSFTDVKCGFHFAPMVRGRAYGNVMPCEPFGAALPPEQFEFFPLEHPVEQADSAEG